jgi:hypothetical protein
MRVIRYLRRVLAQAGSEPKETWSALACIGLLWLLVVVVAMTWGPQP